MPTVSPSAFVPTPAQRKLLDYMDASPCLKTIGELCAGAGIPRRSYYNWSRDPAFRAWFAQAWSARLIMDNAVLFNQARLLASRHFSYWRALFNLTMDPKGLALLQQWQENCAALSSDAFITADPDADSTDSAPKLAPAPPQPNQPLPPNSGTNSQPTTPVRQRLGTNLFRAAAAPLQPGSRPCPTPVQHTRALRQALNHHRRSRHPARPH